MTEWNDQSQMKEATQPQPSDYACFVFQEREQHYGEPDLVFAPETEEAQEKAPSVEVHYWKAEPGCALNTFATLGMVDFPMPGMPHRAELEWSIDAVLDSDKEVAIAAFLANLAHYPVRKNSGIDFWHVIPVGGTIPEFPSCRWVFFHPAFSDEGWDRSVYPPEELTVRILRVIPITDSEKNLLMDEGIAQLMRYFREFKIDFFKPR